MHLLLKNMMIKRQLETIESKNDNGTWLKLPKRRLKIQTSSIYRANNIIQNEIPPDAKKGKRNSRTTENDVVYKEKNVETYSQLSFI